ncbi:MAG: hypothetical protein PUE01_09070 [Clostridiaceae bacterium]|nr:hypothetical protein [Clostridiaceae bacterium]
MKLDSRLSRVTDDFGTLLDKAISEPEFRWYMVTNKDEVIKKYNITDKNDLQIYEDIISKIKLFVETRCLKELEDNNVLKNVDYKMKYNHTNPKLKYEEALVKRHHN